MSKENGNLIRISGYVDKSVFDGIETIKTEIGETFPGARVTYGMALSELYRRYNELRKEVNKK